MYPLRQPDLGMLSFDAADQALQARLQQDLTRRLHARDLASAAVLLWNKGSFDQAVAVARKAFELEPAGCEPLLQEGRGLLTSARQQQAAGRLEEAIRFAARAAAIAPHLLAAYIQLADLLAQSGKWADAVQALRSATTRVPDNRQVLNNLAWMLATSPDDRVRSGAEALQLAERLCAAESNPTPRFLGTLAAAYAETGRFADAAAAAASAADLAARGNDPALARQIREQLALYRQGQPFRQPSVR
jgi:tetratricopeptide (TPR) repeat protein